MDSRLRGIQAFVSGFTLGAPVIAKAALPQLGLSLWLFLAIVLFVTGAVIGSVAQARGGWDLPDPAGLTGEWLAEDEATCRKDMVAFAGDDFASKRRQINKKGSAATLMTWIFLAEVTCLVAWVAAG